MSKVLVALSLTILVPAAARAQRTSPSRFEVGLRLGWAGPVGSAYADRASGRALSLSDGFRSQVPIQVEAGYRLTDRITAGAYASYGFDSVGRAVKVACDAVPTSCSARTIRVGAQGSYRLADIRRSLSAWLGLGVGWEWSTFSRSRALDVTFSGPEIVSLQAGADWRAGPKISLGPFFQASVGRFWSIDQSAVAPVGSSSVDLDTRTHAWLGLGLRGTIHL